MSLLNTTGPHPEEPAKRASRRMAASTGASWFETPLARLLTMRVCYFVRRAFATSSAVTSGAALPQALRI